MKNIASQKSASPCRSRHLELQLKSARKWTGPTMILTNGTEFSGHFGWNGERGIHLSISIFFGNVPVEWPEPFELPTENSGFCCQMVNGPDLENTLRFRDEQLIFFLVFPKAS